MTREEAIKWFRESPFWHKDHEPFNMAIKALEQEPITKNDLSSELEKNSKKLEKNFGELDCISRADALNCVNWGYSLSDVYKKISDLPSVTPQEPLIVPITEIKYDEDKLKELVSKCVLTVTPQEPRWIHAKWKQLDNEPDTFFTTHQYECSNCGKIQLAKSKNIKKFKYCSKCGADMREVENE